MRVLFAAAIALIATATAAPAQYPDRPVKLVVPQAAGSATDNTARILAQELAKELGQSVIIENRPGGAFVIGNDAVAKAPADGYTLLFGNIGGLAISPHMVARLPYDIARDFQPIAVATFSHLLLASAPRLPVTNVAELVALAKQNPGKLSNASSGSGSPGHVGGELFKHMAGVEIVHVPYKGGTTAITDLIAGRVDLMFESLSSSAPHARERAIRPLAVSGAKRSSAFPDIPTIAEAGVPGYEAPTWSGVLAPAGTPRAIVDKLNAAVNRALASESFKARFAQIGDELGGGTPEEFAALIKHESAKWSEVVKRSGAKLE
ncbi:MAG TPA: tripartite tricarboxylate transporter substrate binding protein [Xanthobacteraceae bacterium]|jgi:tripartite-type tricarboxylate transporter receptor subunit TctC